MMLGRIARQRARRGERLDRLVRLGVCLHVRIGVAERQRIEGWVRVIRGDCFASYPNKGGQRWAQVQIGSSRMCLQVIEGASNLQHRDGLRTDILDEAVERGARHLTIWRDEALDRSGEARGDPGAEQRDDTRWANRGR